MIATPAGLAATLAWFMVCRIRDVDYHQPSTHAIETTSRRGLILPRPKHWSDIAMKSLHLPNLFTWTDFNEERNIDFNSVLICLDGGNIVIDPLPLGEHDLSHLKQMGGIDWIVLTNSDHIRDAAELRQHFNAKVAGPAGEKEGFGYDCDRWLKHGDDMADVLKVMVMDGSKTSGELCLLYDDQTLITGDLIRAHKPQSLMVLPDAKLKDPQAALESIRRLTEYTQIETVLVGDGWHLFAEGHKELCALVGRLEERLNPKN